MEQSDDDGVASEADGADWGTEGELTNAARGMVVPKESFCVGVGGGGGGGGG